MCMCDFAGHLLFGHILRGRGRDCMLSVREQGKGASHGVGGDGLQENAREKRLLQVLISEQHAVARGHCRP